MESSFNSQNLYVNSSQAHGGGNLILAFSAYRHFLGRAACLPRALHVLLALIYFFIARRVNRGNLYSSEGRI